MELTLKDLVLLRDMGIVSQREFEDLLLEYHFEHEEDFKCEEEEDYYFLKFN